MRFLPLLLLALLAGCATLPEGEPGVDPEQAWGVHRASLDRVDSWELSGRLGVQAEDDAWHAGLSWRQEGQRYTIHINAPFGKGSLRLEGDGARVVLTASDGSRQVAADAELLLYEQLGWSVPVSALRYWVLGLPAPGPAKRILDPLGRLSRLEQSGWSIQFHNYQSRDGVVLPGRVFAGNHQAKVRLVVQRWQAGR